MRRRADSISDQSIKDRHHTTLTGRVIAVLDCPGGTEVDVTIRVPVAEYVELTKETT